MTTAVSAAAVMEGLRANAIATPKTVAKSDVAKYRASTVPPIRPELRSGMLAAPSTSEKKMIG